MRRLVEWDMGRVKTTRESNLGQVKTIQELNMGRVKIIRETNMVRQLRQCTAVWELGVHNIFDPF